MNGHDQLKNRYCFHCTLALETALSISSGVASDVTDAPFIRTTDQRIYIPGSSIRGAIRAELERVIAGIGTYMDLKSCSLFDEDENGCAEQIKRKFESQTDLKDKDYEEFVDKLCDVCQLFGSTIHGSHIFFEDAFCSQNDGVKSCVRDGVGIDRDTGSAVDGAKYDYEVIETGQHFSFDMFAENLSDTGKKIINLILALLKEGIYIGGKKAGGLGKVKLLTEYKITGFDDPKTLWERLSSGSDLLQEVNWKEDISC